MFRIEGFIQISKVSNYFTKLKLRVFQNLIIIPGRRHSDIHLQNTKDLPDVVMNLTADEAERTFLNFNFRLQQLVLQLLPENFTFK